MTDLKMSTHLFLSLFSRVGLRKWMWTVLKTVRVPTYHTCYDKVEEIRIRTHWTWPLFYFENWSFSLLLFGGMLLLQAILSNSFEKFAKFSNRRNYSLMKHLPALRKNFFNIESTRCRFRRISILNTLTELLSISNQIFRNYILLES